MLTINYLPTRERILLPFILSFYFIYYSGTAPAGNIINAPHFYYNLLFDYTSLSAMIHITHYMTIYLDKIFAWNAVPKQRLFLQLLSFVITMLIIYLLIYAYLSVLDIDAGENGFTIREFNVFNWMALSFNLSYLLWYSIAKIRHLKNKKDSIDTGATISCVYPVVLAVDFSSSNFHIHVADVAFFQRDNNNGWVYLKDGSKKSIKYKLKDLINILDPESFIVISRSVIVAFDVIDVYATGSRKSTVVLKRDLNQGLTLKISEGKLSHFERKLLAYLKSNPVFEKDEAHPF